MYFACNTVAVSTLRCCGCCGVSKAQQSCSAAYRAGYIAVDLKGYMNCYLPTLPMRLYCTKLSKLSSLCTMAHLVSTAAVCVILLLILRCVCASRMYTTHCIGEGGHTGAAKREAAARVILNGEKIVKFACRFVQLDNF
jgi:hypothetical protein